MADVQTQTTERPDVNAVTEALSQQINHLIGDIKGVRGQSSEKQVQLDALEQTMDNSERAVGALEELMDGLGRAITASNAELARLDDLYKNLQEEQAKLDEAGHALYQKVSVQDQQLKEIKEAGEQQYMDINRARFLRDEIRDEFYQKEEELKIAEDRLQQQNVEFFKQFEEMKADVKKHRRKAAPLLEELDSCEKATITRLNHFIRSDNISAGDLEKSDKLKKFLELNSRYRRVFDEVGDLEFEVRNSERALEFSQSQMRAKMSRMESLERELSEMEGVFREGMGCFLRRTPRRVDLTAPQDGPTEQESDLVSDEEEQVEREEFGHVGGRGLHRCVKVTDIRLQLQQQEAEAEVEVEVEEEAGEEVKEDQEDVHGEEAGYAGDEEADDEHAGSAGFEKEKEEDGTGTQAMNITEEVLKQKLTAAQKSEETSPRTSSGPVLEGVTATDKALSSIAQRGDRLLSKGSRSNFVKPAHRTELRATGSSATYSQTASGRKQKK